MANCEISAANGITDRPCDMEACIYWRALSHLSTEDAPGCAIQHFSLLGDEGVARWLLTVKARYEQVESAGC